jgi:Protein of unknown function (DUF3375)
MPFRMDTDQLAWDLQNEPSIKLLKAENGAFILSFLHQQFKYAQRVSIPLPEFLEQLEGYLTHLNEHEPGRYPRSAQGYITEWANEEHRYIRIALHSNSDIPDIELTSDAERTLGWLEDMHAQSFVGTESRFLMIIQLLREIVQKSTIDPGERLAQLREQRAALDEQIAVIEQSGRVENRYNPTQLRERFLEASALARQLLRDFRLVEDRFRALARSIQEAQMQPGMRKGTVVEYVLDTDAELKNSDQGRSFYTFWEFLISPSQSDEFQQLLDGLTTLAELRSSLREDHLIQRLPGYLVAAGEKVVLSNARLAEQLRRLLDEQMRAENRRVQELIQQIKQEIYPLALPGETPFLELEGAPETLLVMEREMWEPARTQQFQAPTLEQGKVDLQDIHLDRLYTQFTIDEALLTRRIETLLEQRPQVLLSEVLTQYPIEKGLAEVLTYCELAARDSRHSFDLQLTDEILVSSAGDSPLQEKHVTLPRIYYRRGAYAQ